MEVLALLSQFIGLILQPCPINSSDEGACSTNLWGPELKQKQCESSMAGVRIEEVSVMSRPDWQIPSSQRPTEEGSGGHFFPLSISL